ncbi:hypothetical protein ZWY2020_040846 [Hordeum vulgare]|nr:hypothetical protein ZWY2020_040846 [Hordeum vulgare]
MGIYITRWSAKRLREIANTVKEKKRDVISKSSFGDLLHISPLPPPPEELVDFIVMRIDTKKRLLKFDCGLFSILYMENLTARGLKPFNTDTTSLLNFRKYIAAKLFKHPQNTLSSEEELEKLLKKS